MGKAVIPVAAIVAITALEAIALLQHIDGAILSVAIAAIAGLGGYTLRVLRE